jgi:hypothetical protein
MARIGEFGSMPHGFHLALAAHELGVTACGRALQASAQRSQPGHLVHRDRFTNPLDLGGSERSEEEVTLTQLPNRLGRRD